LRVLVLTGPTGVGKTEVAAILAKSFGIDIISADSRQVYRYLDIGTAKPSTALRKEIRFHLVDCVEPNQLYSAADFARDALKIMRELRTKGRGFIVVGGSGFYLRALFRPLFDVPKYDPNLRAQLSATSLPELYKKLMKVDPERAKQIHPNDRQRVIRALEVYELTGKKFSELTAERQKRAEFIPVYVVLNMERKRLYRLIKERFDQMMAQGLLNEVRRLKEMGLNQNSYATNAYGYIDLFRYLDGDLSLEEAISQAKRKTKEYARRQLTWFRGLTDAIWLELTTPPETAEKLAPLLLDLLNNKR